MVRRATVQQQISGSGGRREGGRWRRGLHADDNVLVDARLFTMGVDTAQSEGEDQRVR
jgi:hypothetical protein